MSSTADPSEIDEVGIAMRGQPLFGEPVLRLRLSVSNSPSGRHGELNQTTAMGYPADIVELYTLDGFPDGDA